MMPTQDGFGETDPLMEHTDGCDHGCDDGNTTGPFQPDGASTPVPGEQIPLSIVFSSVYISHRYGFENGVIVHCLLAFLYTLASRRELHCTVKVARLDFLGTTPLKFEN